MFTRSVSVAKVAVFLFAISAVAVSPSGFHAESSPYHLASRGLITEEPADWLAVGEEVLVYGDGDLVRVAFRDDPASVLSERYLDGPAADGILLGRYLYLARADEGLDIWDLAIPEEPFHVGWIPLGGRAGSLAATGNLLLAAVAGRGVAVLDFMHLPFPHEVGFLDYSDPITDLAAWLDTVWLATPGGILGANLADPAEPAWESYLSLDGSVSAIASGEGILMASNGDGTAAWDVSNPLLPERLGTLPLSGSDFALGGRTLLMAGASGIHHLRVGREEAASVEVLVGNVFFNPSTVTINPSDTVKWRWVGGGHSTTSGACQGSNCTSDGIWDSGIKSAGEFEFEFLEAGSFPYFCRVHRASQKGTVVVEPSTSIIVETSADPAGGPAPLAVNFSASASGGEAPYDFDWDFGDGVGTSNFQNPSYTFSDPGMYTVKLEVRDAQDVRADDLFLTITVMLMECQLQCGAEVPAGGMAGGSMGFTGTHNHQGCQGQASYQWDFGDGMTSSEPGPSHSYVDPGMYHWMLTVTVDGQTCTRDGFVEIEAAPVLPGDCSGDGIVSIGEVQQSINMFLGVQGPNCSTDCSKDGTVSIGEVQRVINGFLGQGTTC